MPFSVIVHWRQPRDGDCFPACVAMVLPHLGETTEFLPYWLTRPDLDDSARLVEHAVVVVGLTGNAVAVYDPDLADAPQLVALDWFLAAWQGQHYRYAVIRRRGWRK